MPHSYEICTWLKSEPSLLYNNMINHRSLLNLHFTLYFSQSNEAMHPCLSIILYPSSECMSHAPRQYPYKLWNRPMRKPSISSAHFNTVVAQSKLLCAPRHYTLQFVHPLEGPCSHFHSLYLRHVLVIFCLLGFFWELIVDWYDHVMDGGGSHPGV